jgi:predicted metalloenzyme YecM
MFFSLANFFAASVPFVQTFDAWSARMTPDATADHICYKCSSTEEFEQIRKLFESASTFIYQSIISNRRIAIIKFLEPIQTSLGPIWFLELSDQKLDGSQKSEFDHIEIYPNTGTMDELAASLESKGQAFEKIIRPHHTTHDTFIEGSFKVRLEPDVLIGKIKREEIV